MTDIIKLARKVWGESAILPFSELERFAELVAAPLKAENEAMLREIQNQYQCIRSHAEITQKAEADAERYRWLRNTSQISASSTGKGIAFPHYVTREMQRCELDAAIDAARAKEQT